MTLPFPQVTPPPSPPEVVSWRTGPTTTLWHVVRLPSQTYCGWDIPPRAARHTGLVVLDQVCKNCLTAYAIADRVGAA